MAVGSAPVPVAVIDQGRKVIAGDSTVLRLGTNRKRLRCWTQWG